MEVIWHQRAIRQFESAMNYCLARFGRRTTRRVMDQVDKIVLLLSENPEMGAMEERLRDLGIFRYVLVGPAKLVYTVEDGYLFIHLYWDCRQDSDGMINYLDD